MVVASRHMVFKTKRLDEIVKGVHFLRPRKSAGKAEARGWGEVRRRGLAGRGEEPSEGRWPLKSGRGGSFRPRGRGEVTKVGRKGAGGERRAKRGELGFACPPPPLTCRLS